MLLILLAPGRAQAGLFNLLKTGADTVKQVAPIFIAGGIEEKRHQLKTLQEKQAELETRSKEGIALLQGNLDKVNKQIKDIKIRLKDLPMQPDLDLERQKEFLNEKLTKLNTQYQTLIDLQLYKKQRLTMISEHIVLLQSYLKDPTFKGMHVELRAFYTFEDLQNLNRRIADTEERLNYLVDQRNNTKLELENRKRDLQVAQQLYKAKKQEQETFSAKRTDASDLTIKQQGEFLNLQENLLADQQQLYESQIKELYAKLLLLESQIFIQESHVNILKDDLVRVVKPSVRVDNSDVAAAEEVLAKKKQKTTEITKSYYQQVKNWTVARDQKKKEFEALAKKYNEKIDNGKVFSGWDLKPDSVASWVTLSEMGYFKEQVALLDQEIDLYKGKILLENQQLDAVSKGVEIIKSWNSITLRKLTTPEEIAAEKKQYEAAHLDMQRELNMYMERRNTTTNALNMQNKALNKVRQQIKNLRQQRSAVFKRDISNYTRTLNLLADSEKMISRQIDLNGGLIDTYSSLVVVLSNSLKQVNSIIGELETIGIWQRSIHAISWSGVKNIVPDVEKFFVELRGIIIAYVSQWNFEFLTNIAKKFIYNPLDVALALIIIILLIVFGFILHTYLPELEKWLLHVSDEHKGYHFGSRLFAVIVGFASIHFIGLLAWSLIFALVKAEYLALALRIIFYLGSIPYLIWLARKFRYYFLDFNKEHQYVLLSEQFQKRFIQVFTVVAYSTIIILLFREAFILASYHKSELPTILLAFYSVIFRTLLIFLIGKEEILSIIPQTSTVWSWVWRLVDKYYYVMLSAIVVVVIMSDPYIGGYGNLVFYLLSGLVLTGLLVYALIWLHNYIKKGASHLFFDTSEDSLRERFTNAKTWYGIFIIMLFVSFVMFTVLIGARIWGTIISFEDIRGVFTNQLFTVGAGEDRQAITVSSFIEVIVFMVSGFFLAVVVNRFVLRKIFDLLLIDSGVQNIVSILTRYLIVITAIVIGFQKVGLSSLLISIGVLIAGIGWMITEPIKDFASYFIILIQRPIKIGDFIRLMDGQQGVVRKITPRATILRAKNSYSIIVPNSELVTQKVDNWNYTRNFVAINDILLTVPYWVDPKRVKQIMLGVLEHHSDILKNPPPIIRLSEFVPHGYKFMVRGFLSSVNTLNKWDIASDIRFDLVQALHKNGIKLATPFTSVKMVTEDIDPLSLHPAEVAADEDGQNDSE